MGSGVVGGIVVVVVAAKTIETRSLYDTVIQRLPKQNVRCFRVINNVSITIQ